MQLSCCPLCLCFPACQSLSGPKMSIRSFVPCLRPAIPCSPWSPFLWTPMVPLQGKQGRMGLQRCYVAQPHSYRFTHIIRSQKSSTYINDIILRPSFIPFPCCVQWSGRTPRATVVSCWRPFPQSFSVLQPRSLRNSA